METIYKREVSDRIIDFNAVIYSSMFAEKLNACHEEMTAINVDLPKNEHYRIAGVCFVTRKAKVEQLAEHEFSFYTRGVVATIVMWDNSYDPDGIKIWGMSEDEGEYFFEGTKTFEVTEEIPAAQGAFSVLGISPATLERYFTDTAEFDLAFIDIDKFMELSGIVLDPDNLYMVQENPDTSPYPEDVRNQLNEGLIKRGIHLSRAFIVMDAESENLKRYRTLKLRPEPEPVVPAIDSRPAVSFHIMPPCPPDWSQGYQFMSLLIMKYMELDWISMTPPEPYQPSWQTRLRANPWILLFLLLAGLLTVAAVGKKSWWPF